MNLPKLQDTRSIHQKKKKKKTESESQVFLYSTNEQFKKVKE